ncbi:LysR family transcriptional regulator [Pseudomonas gingeri]|uniref:LysR family transcriptional regulator n=1 Tax=Pseudomonas gingeri TaxID=117681 RepID=A0A7Y7XBU6_9PSED|nr:LysR family transcriptional regulator [Pseudomonas gingeri]NWA24544.1 LysR family transcriptional regulator [Pseudomonas gingeri]NWB96834.1 LysR family transcriptional regulator [Pseudomonas gingeri]NWD67163.1 LysR family transcriptional regulator [Pseudomonas gingeri]NWD77329.1 LysR family transcriptional regulator [Pseudomonas gingeri]
MNDDISLWRLFFRIVERGSLSRAAEDLNLEPSSVSRRLSALEKRVEVRLLNRSTRMVTLTDAGSRAYEQMKPLVAEMEGVLADLDSRSPKIAGVIRMTAPVNFGERFLTKWLTAFQRRHPQVLIDLVLSDHRIDLKAEAMDLAMRVGELPTTDLVARRIGEMPNVLCASRGYIALHGMPSTPEDLVSHRAILYSLGRERNRTRLKMSKQGREVSVELNGVFHLNNVGAIEQAVSDGAGIHPGPRWLFNEGIASGALIELLPDWSLMALPVHLLRLEARYEPKRVRALGDWIAQCWSNELVNH